ncbi:hypothetical protein NHP21005_16020 [Helicobacter sp. NHP21005]|nr:hypothetical protein NHP21005_16020 [Helicobacter sp. NHP21005]
MCLWSILKEAQKERTARFDLDPRPFILSPNPHHAYHTDAKDIICQLQTDILYLDPPYNQREYGANYHILNSIALYDNFTPQGKTGLRAYDKSAWCKKSLAPQSLEHVIKHTHARFVFLSYNNEGLLDLRHIQEVMRRYGDYTLLSQEHPRFTSSPNIKEHTTEYLHVLVKG